MTHYTKHIFFCTNKKSNGKGCGMFGGEEAFETTKTQLQSLDMWGEGKIRASKSGCLGRCANNPVCVVYPDGVWYSYFDMDDISKIVTSHLINNQVVSELQVF